MTIPYRLSAPYGFQKVFFRCQYRNSKLITKINTGTTQCSDRNSQFLFDRKVNKVRTISLWIGNQNISNSTYTNIYKNIENRKGRRFFSTDVESSSGKDAKHEKALDLNKDKKVKDVVPIRLNAPDDGLNHNLTVLEWYKGEGDSVEANEALCEIDTPDFSFDFQSSVGGVIAKVITPAGTQVAPGDALAYLAENEESVQAVVTFLEKEETQKQKQLLEIQERNESQSKTFTNEVSDLNDHQIQLDDELHQWLKSVKEEFVEYENVFREEGFDSLEAIETLTEEDLLQMGIKKGHIRILIKSVESMNQ